MTASRATVHPEGWTTQPLGSLLSRPPSYGVNAAASPYAPDAPTYIRITDISPDGYFAPNPKVSVRHPASALYLLTQGDLLFARTGASVGKSYLYRAEDGQLVFAGFLIRITPDADELDPSYLAYFAQSKQYWDWVAVTSVRSGQPGINGKEYAQLPVVVPPIDEQRAIAESLSTVERLITSLEQQVEKKRDIKEAVMQQLLTGRTRLPGYLGKWERVSMSSLGTTYGGLTAKTKADFGVGDSRYVPFMDVMNHVQLHGRDLPRVAVAEGEQQNAVAVDDLLFNGSSETPEELALCAVVKQVPANTYLNSFCFGFRLNTPDLASPLFLAYLFRSQVGRALLRALAQGAIRYNLAKAQFRTLELLLPRRDEQLAIAALLSDMDAEIDALSARLQKTKDIKRGILQELLSGRARIVRSEVPA